MRKNDDIHGEKSKKKSHLQGETGSRDDLLAEAQRNRRLLSSLIDSDWLGLELLMEIGSSSLGTTIEPSQRNTSTLDRLVDCGLLESQDGRFYCAELGKEIVAKTENLIGSPTNC